MEEIPVNVLLVDDEEAFLSSTGKVLKRRGMTVFTVSSGEEALSILRANPIEVVVLDVKMPDADGHELFYEIKRLRPKVQIIMLTGHGRFEKAVELGAHGLFDYIPKPCDIDLLARRIREAAMGMKSDQAEQHHQLSRVLLVDDEADFLSSTKRVLSRRGMIVLTAADGAEALLTIAREKIDVAVIDLKMPGMPGEELLKRIKQTAPRVEVIVLTGHGNILASVNCMKSGASDVLFKPQSPDQLADAILVAAEKSKTGK